MAQRYEYQDIEGHIILLFVHPADDYGLGMQTSTQKKASANRRMPEKPLPG